MVRFALSRSLTLITKTMTLWCSHQTQCKHLVRAATSNLLHYSLCMRVLDTHICSGVGLQILSESLARASFHLCWYELQIRDGFLGPE